MLHACVRLRHRCHGLAFGFTAVVGSPGRQGCVDRQEQFVFPKAVPLSMGIRLSCAPCTIRARMVPGDAITVSTRICVALCAPPVNKGQASLVSTLPEKAAYMEVPGVNIRRDRCGVGSSGPPEGVDEGHGVHAGLLPPPRGCSRASICSAGCLPVGIAQSTERP